MVAGSAGSAGFEGHYTRRGGVVELGLPSEEVEARDVHVQLRARQRAARVDELHLIDNAFIALATGNAKGIVCGIRPRLRGGDRIGTGLEPIQRLLHLELDLLRNLIPLRCRPPRGGSCATLLRMRGAAIE